jgi:hypothetical protein
LARNREDHHRDPLGEAVRAIGGTALFGSELAGAAYGLYKLRNKFGTERIIDAVATGARKLSSGLDLVTGAVEGLTRTASSAGLLDTLSGRATHELQENLRESLESWANGKAGVLGGRQLRTEHLGLGLKRGLHDTENQVLDDVRRAEVRRQLIANNPQATPEMLRHLEPILSSSSAAMKAGFHVQTPGLTAQAAAESGFKRTVGYHKIGQGFTGTDRNIMTQTMTNLKQLLMKSADKQAFQVQYGTRVKAQVVQRQKNFVEAMLANAEKTYGGSEYQGFFAKVLGGLDPQAKLHRATYDDLYTHRSNPLDKRRVQTNKGPQGGRAFYEGLLDEVKKLDSQLGKDSNLESRFRQMVVDPNLYIGPKKQLIDLHGLVRAADRATDFLYREFQIPLVGLRPAVLIRPFVPKNPNEYAYHVFEAGVKTNIGHTFAEQTQRTTYYAGRLFQTDLADAGLNQTVTDKVYLTRFGAHRRALQNMDDSSRLAPDFAALQNDPRPLARVRDVLDLGMNENRGVLGDILSIVTKGDDPTHTRNIIHGIDANGELSRTTGFLRGVRKKGARLVEDNTRNLSRRQWGQAESALRSTFGDSFYNTLTSGSTEAGAMGAMRELVGMDGMEARLGKSRFEQFQRHLAQYDADNDIFHHVQSAHGDAGNEAIWDNVANTLNLHSSDPQTYGDKYTRDLQAAIIGQILPDSRATTINGVFQGASAKDASQVLDMAVHSKFSAYTDSDQDLGVMARFIAGKGQLGGDDELNAAASQRFRETILKSERLYGPKPQPAPSVGTDVPVVVRQSKILDQLFGGIGDINRGLRNGTYDLNDPASTDRMVKTGFQAIGNTFAQAFRESGFGGAGRAGRGNLDQATEFTTSIYNTFNRMNDMLSSASLGLSKRFTGSAQDLAANLLTRRYILPAIGLGYAMYANDQLGNLTGTEPTDALVKGYAGISLGMQKVKDITGLTGLQQQLDRLTPGSEQLWGSPLLAPVKWGTFGLLGDDRGYEGLHDYLTTGDEAVRKGRWWSIGSNTPWTGGRVMGYRPSYYRRALGEPTMTDSLWGSENEFWANNPLPTPHNPLGPLKTWVLDNKHWEKKHQYDRPTPVAGGIPEFLALPVIGPLLDATAGQILKPNRKDPGFAKAHRAYLKEINEAIKADQTLASQGSVLYRTPGGRGTLKAAPDDDTVTEDISPYPDEIYSLGDPAAGTATAALGSSVVQGGTLTAQPGGATGVPGAVPGTAAAAPGMYPVYDASAPTPLATGPAAKGKGAAAARAALTRVNLGLMDVADLDQYGSRNVHDLATSNLQSQVDRLSAPGGLGFAVNESYYQTREMMGLRGFALERLLGDPGKPQMMLQSSSRYAGYERRFWDQQMGGAGGDLSEVMRRFLPHRRRDIQEYNPMPNNMPSWMPSNTDYFQDYQHGDFYLNTPFGESMLPGEGYESVNKLHPDAYFGRYGALDRMKILANAAPWSEQYKYYSKVTSAMHGAGLYTDDEYKLAQQAREEAKERKKKYRFYNYKFHGDEIAKHQVTIDRMLDPYTFMAAEDPGVVYRLAGVKGPKSPNTPEGAAINDLSAQYLAAGLKVTVGVAQDPLARNKQDVLGTTSAVVWSKGVKVNQALLKADKVQANYDATDPASVNALYNPLERAVGRTWESIAHLDNPINNKFLSVRSPLEMYERNFVYGKEFQSWDHPLKDWVQPTMAKMAKNDPLLATGTGALLGSLFMRSKTAKAAGAVVGGTVGLALTGGRVLNEVVGRLGDPDYAWVPQDERRVRDIEEYFDMLKYVKFKGLYERSTAAARKYENTDVPKLLADLDTGTAGSKKEVALLKKVKRMIKMSMGDSIVNEEEAKARLGAVNDRLNELAGAKQGIRLGPIATQALQYKQQYEQTLAGADPNGDLMNILAALPKRDRAFFQELIAAKPAERQRILSIVPKNQRRFYQTKWGLKADKAPTPLGYFATHHLPGAAWHGWEPDADLDEIKLKFINTEGLDLAEFGNWETDLPSVDANTPRLGGMGGFLLDTLKLQGVLEGRGISNVDINITREQTQDPSQPFTMNFQLDHDRRPDIVELINKNITMLMRG